MDMIRVFSLSFARASGDVYNEAFNKFLIMQQANSSPEDKIIIRWNIDGEISAADYIRVQVRFISFYLTYLEFYYPAHFDEIIRQAKTY